jgi:hypothetical protein
MFIRRDGENYCPQRKEQQNLHRTDHVPGSNDFLYIDLIIPLK